MAVKTGILLISLLSGVGGTGLGGLIGAWFRAASQRTVSLLLAFAAGVMLSVVCFDLIPGAQLPDTGAPLAPFFVIVSILLGYFLVVLLHAKPLAHAISRQAPAAGEAAGRTPELHLFLSGMVMAATIALHNFPEGMAIGSSYASSSAPLLSGSGFLIALVIALHNVPEGMAITVPLVAGAMPPGRAVLLAAASGFPTVFGALCGLALGRLGALCNCFSLGFASGAMLHVVLGELLPQSIRGGSARQAAFVTLSGMLLGFLLANL